MKVSNLRQYIVSCIDTDYLEIPETSSHDDKIRAVYACFMSEIGHWHIPQVGRQNAIQYWLQGVTPVVKVEIYNSAIISLLESWGDLKPTSRDDTISKRIDQYWTGLAYALLREFESCKLM